MPAKSVKLVSLLQRGPRSASVGSGAQKWPGAVMNDQYPLWLATVKSERRISPHGGQEQPVSDAASDIVDLSW